MGDKVHCKLNFRIMKQNSMPGVSFDGVVLTVVPNKPSFTIVYNKNMSMDFRPEEFREFPDRPKLAKATVFTIDFLENDEMKRKQLYLKFGASSELATIYDALLPMFEQAGKLAKKKAKKGSCGKENNLDNFYAKSPGNHSPKRSRNCGSLNIYGSSQSRAPPSYSGVQTQAVRSSSQRSIFSQGSQVHPNITCNEHSKNSKSVQPKDWRTKATVTAGSLCSSAREIPQEANKLSDMPRLETNSQSVQESTTSSVVSDVGSDGGYVSFTPTSLSPIAGSPSDFTHVPPVTPVSYAQAASSKIQQESPRKEVAKETSREETSSIVKFTPMFGQSKKIPQPKFMDRVLTSPWRFRSFDNLGNSCYMNSVLQVFYYSSGTQSRLRRLKGNIEFRANCSKFVTNLFDFDKKMRHLKDLVDSNDKPRDYIRNVLEKIRENSGVELDSDFSSFRQQDAHEYWTKLVDHLNSNIKKYEKVMEACKEISNHPTSQKPLIEDKKPTRRFQNPADFNSLFAPGDLFKIQTVSSCLALKEARTEESLDMKLDIDDNVFCEESVDYLVRKCLKIEVLEFACDKCGSKDANKTQAVQTFPSYLMLVVMRYHYNNGSGRKKNNSILIDRELFLDPIHADSAEKQDERDVLHKERAEKANLKQDVSMKFVLPVFQQSSLFDDVKNSRVSYFEEFPGNGSLHTADYLSKPEFSDCNFVSEEICKLGCEYMEVDDVPRNEDLNLSIEEHMESSSPDEDHTMVPSWKPGLFGGDSSRFNIQLDGDLDTQQDSEPIIVSESSSSDAANIYFKPLTSKVLFDIRNELTIAHLVLSEESIWYESVFLPECELSCGEVPEKFSVDGDGNCLFRSLSWWLFNGVDEHYDTVRMLITDFLTMFPAEFSRLLNEGETMDDHISNMRNDFIWGSHVELSAAATMFRCPIFTYYNNAWKKFPPLFATYFDEQERRYEKLSGPVEYDVVIKGAIYLSNEEGFHYDPVVGRKIRPEMHSLEHPEPMYLYKESDGHVYTLTGVINHIGTSMTCGHYKAMTFDDERGVWVNCDDSYISVISEKEVLKEGGRNGYMLIYKKRTVGDEMEFTHSNEYLKRN